MTNSIELYQRISKNEAMSDMTGDHRVLGVQWNPLDDRLIFDISDIVCLMRDMSPAKRNVMSLATRFYDPLGMISPIIVWGPHWRVSGCVVITGQESPAVAASERSKVLCSSRCHSTIRSIRLLRCISTSVRCSCLSLHSQTQSEKVVSLLCSKTRVAPVKSVTILRLERYFWLGWWTPFTRL